MRISARKACLKPHLRTRSNIKYIVTSQAGLLSLNDAILWTLLFCTPVFSPECAGQGSECSGSV